jgi:hypothetical protein
VLVACHDDTAGGTIAGVSSRISGIIVNARMHNQGTAIGIED